MIDLCNEAETQRVDRLTKKRKRERGSDGIVTRRIRRVSLQKVKEVERERGRERKNQRQRVKEVEKEKNVEEEKKRGREGEREREQESKIG